MRRVSAIIVTMMLLAICMAANNAAAVDFGMYAEFGGGSGEAELDIAGADEFDIDSNFWGLGFQFETSPLTAGNLFSYRFQAGFESRDIEDEENTTLELGGVVINNTFAFGGNVSEKVRLWGGPQVMVGFYSGETDKELLGDDISFTGAAFGLGAAGGANFGLGSGTTILTTTIGLRSMGFAGNVEWFDEDERMDGTISEIYLSVGLLF